jgi:glycyl-tRNA synthetase
MRMNGIVVNKEKRREQITAVSNKLAAEMGGTIPDDPGLLEEVTNLVEKPTPLRGGLSKRFLALPAEVLVAVMRKHQRYFPVYAANNQLLPYFIAVRNGDESISTLW